MSLLPNRPTEHAASLRVRIEQARRGIDWRKRVYGAACLTHREYEACCLSMYYDTDVAIAARMRISPRRVGQLLNRASLILMWMETHGVAFAWVRDAGALRFHCPHATHAVAYEDSA